MKIAIGSKNPAKVAAVRGVLQLYEGLRNAELCPCAVESGVSSQPRSIKETAEGAIKRARTAFESVEGCYLSIGLESGLMEFPDTETGHLQHTVCAIFNGSIYGYGTSSGFEIPVSVMEFINSGYALNDAVHMAGFTEDTEIRKGDGFIALLTGGKLTRAEYTKQAIINALSRFDEPDFFAEKGI